MLPEKSGAQIAASFGWLAGGWLLMLALSRLTTRWPRRWALVGLMLAPLCFVRGLSGLEHYGPEKHPAALASEINTSYFQMAAQIDDVRAFLRHYPERMSRFPMHGATHPAGWPLKFHQAIVIGRSAAGTAVAAATAFALGAEPAAARALAADVARRPLTDPETAGLWIVVLSVLLALMALPAAVYFAARAHEAPRIAFRAAGLAAALSAPLLFFPDVDVLHPTLAVVAAGCWLRSERPGKARWAFLAGIFIAQLAALSFGNLVVIPILALQSVLSWKRRQTGAWFEVRRFGALLLPLVLLWIGAAAVGHDLGAVFAAALGHHRDTLARRTGWLWTLLNPLEFLMLMGIPITAWLLRATPWWHHPQAAKKLRMDPEAALFGATLLVMLALDFSGGTKGEAGRLWMLFMPLLVAGAAALWRDRRRVEWACVTGMALAFAAVLKGFYAFVWLYS